MRNLVPEHLAHVAKGERCSCFLKMTTIPDGSMKGKVIIEVLPAVESRLFDLPPELRERIYRVILVRSRPVILSTSRTQKCRIRVVSGMNFRSEDHHTYQKWDKEKGKWNFYSASWIDLIRVNKQIHREAAPIAYGANTFTQNGSIALTHFVPLIGSAIHHLATIDFGAKCTWSNIKDTLVELRTATGLRKLIFHETMLFGPLKLKIDKLDPAARARDLKRAARKVSTTLRVLLPGLQEAYKASGRTWMAADVPVLQSDERWAGEMGSKDAQEFMEMVRKLNEKYL
ncbi:hypothetical protein TI39_contig632g00004 [Zymoseptoria brevis]|uniref:DUF7730 domain-containing protein n=1 Tax=Zymoseptoria brevis TaxID=1047168 RepID=A0A0F4GJN6_9PEZI|nr:hypothetical protein TI39_contig632g00004 [Zymoseptoria brevis]